ncbi:MAG: hypothetical protein KDE31_36060, partial [Caldilineaceae bacterium]|nr:hypothetical protein [Caldilineaceae bacterium]
NCSFYEFYARVYRLMCRARTCDQDIPHNDIGGRHRYHAAFALAVDMGAFRSENTDGFVDCNGPNIEAGAEAELVPRLGLVDRLLQSAGPCRDPDFSREADARHQRQQSG